MFNKRNSRPLRPISIEGSESDDENNLFHNNLGSAIPLQSNKTGDSSTDSSAQQKNGLGLKPKKLASRKKSNMRTSFQDDIDDENDLGPVIRLKKSNLSKNAFSKRKLTLSSLDEAKIPVENSTKSDVLRSETYTDQYLEDLKRKSSAPKLELTGNRISDIQSSSPDNFEIERHERDKVILDLSDDELKNADIENDRQEQELKESILNNEFDAEEGIGFDDELLPVTEKERQLYDERMQFERAEAFLEAQEEDEENEDEEMNQENRDWEYDQLKKGVISGKNLNKMVTLDHRLMSYDGAESGTDFDFSISIPQQQPIPVLSQSISSLRQKLELMKAKKSNLEKQLEDLTEEVVVIGQKELEVKKNIFLVTEKFESLQLAKDQRNLAESGNTEVSGK